MRGTERPPSGVAWMEVKRKKSGRSWVSIIMKTILAGSLATGGGLVLKNANDAILPYVDGRNPCEESGGIYRTNSLAPGESVIARGEMGGFASIFMGKPSVEVESRGNGVIYYDHGRVQLIEKRPEARRFVSGSDEFIISGTPAEDGGTVVIFECPTKPESTPIQ